MGSKKLFSYTIMPLFLEHLEAICQDIKEQYENGVADCALFQMTLVPEGNPPSNKAEILCQRFAKFQARLKEMGLDCGILVQASVGHGWVLGEMFPYQAHVNFCDGASTRVVCPCDDGFKDYIYNAMKTIASYNPSCIMIDDDFRTIWYKGEGCACPLHMEMFNKSAGTNLSREELWEIVNARGENYKKYTDIYIETQKKSLVETAKIMRQGVDSINPKLPMSYCCCGNNAEFAHEIASVLAGEQNPVTVRINNGNYTPTGAKEFSRVFHRAATQIAKLKGKVDVLLAETDTCPQNRYSTSASSLHTHFTGTILEGANGAKHWITRLMCYEPESGVAYRKILSKYRNFYEKLASLYPTLRWRGCRIFTPSTPDFTYGRVKEEWDGWSLRVLERLGIPMYFSSEVTGVVCLEGDVDSRLSDDDILKILSGSCMLASDTAKSLINRGFGKYLGVDIKEWTGKIPVTERFESGKCTKVQQKAKQIIPLRDDVIISSRVMNTVDYENYEYLFPGVTIYKNELGGTVIVFCGTPVAEFRIDQAFSFLSQSRKKQLIDILSLTDELVLYFTGDEEMYLKVANMDDGRVFASFFNIGLDPIEKLEIACNFAVDKIEMLMPDATTKKIDFEFTGEKYILDTNCNTLEPVILFITKK